MYFDTGASHSFISMLFASVLGLECEVHGPTLILGTPLRGTYSLSTMCKSCCVVIGG